MNQRKDNLHTTKTNELQTSFQHTLNKNKVHCRHFRSLPLTNYQRQINTIFQTARIYINHFFQHIAFLEFSVQLNISYQTFKVYQKLNISYEHKHQKHDFMYCGSLDVSFNR